MSGWIAQSQGDSCRGDASWPACSAMEPWQPGGHAPGSTGQGAGPVLGDTPHRPAQQARLLRGSAPWPPPGVCTEQGKARPQDPGLTALPPHPTAQAIRHRPRVNAWQPRTSAQQSRHGDSAGHPDRPPAVTDPDERPCRGITPAGSRDLFATDEICQQIATTEAVLVERS